MAEGLSNDRVTFKGVTKTGVCELMAVHHRAAHAGSHKIKTAMIGLITDAVVRPQQANERYIRAVKSLFKVITEALTE